MSMIGVSVASSKSLQLEATQEAYNRAVIKLNLLLIEDKTHEEAVRAKLIEVMKERNKLGKEVEKSVDDFLIDLSENYSEL